MAKTMIKIENFIRNHFFLTEEELSHMPRLLNRCEEELESRDTPMCEYTLIEIVDDELSKIMEEIELKELGS